MNVHIVKFNPDIHSNFIYGTMPKSLFFSSVNNLRKKSSFAEFIKNEFSNYLQKTLIDSDTHIAITDEDLQLGYLVLNNSSLEFIFVKPMYRKHGIAKLLIKNKKITAINQHNLTKIGQSILENHPNLFYIKKESTYENDTDRRSTEAEDPSLTSKTH